MINALTDLYCVIGNPVHHSKSPLIHNACFNKYQINAVYLAFKITDIEKAVGAVRQLNIKGVSVTLPFKTSIMPFLDKIDPDAEQIGAVNTIVNKNGRLTGYNTDLKAAVGPLSRITDLAGKNICILGAGGAAKAVCHGLANENANLIIVNRDVNKAAMLASDLNAAYLDLNDVEQIADRRIDVMINTTSVGMSPRTDVTPISDRFLNADMIVMDIIYTPLETKFLADAKSIGCRTIDGLSMFIRQGAEQFRLWTDIEPDTRFMREIILKERRT